MRQTLPAPSFAMSAFAVPISATVGTYMGSYEPQIAQCSTEQFEIDECLSLFTATPTPSATAMASPSSPSPSVTPTPMPATSTPTNTPTATPTSSPSPTNTPSTTPTPTSTPTSTPAPPATLALSPTQLSPTQSITVTGTNFGASEVVKVYWDITSTAALTTATTTSAGSFVAIVKAPQAVVGTHTLIAVGQSSRSVATAPLQIAPFLALAPSSGRSGSTVVATGTGFGATEPIRASWNGSSKLVLGSTMSSAQGYFTGTNAITFTVPISATGSYRVCAKGKRSGATSCPLFKLTG